MEQNQPPRKTGSEPETRTGHEMELKSTKERANKTRRARRFRTVVAVAVPVLLALALGAACIYASERSAYAESLERRVTSQEQDAYYQLHNNINDMQTALLKLKVTASSSRHILLLSDIWRLSGAAVANMAAIPVSHVDTSELNAFLVRIGDYANTLINRILSGGVLAEEDYTQLDALYEASVQIGNKIKERLDRGDFPSSLSVSAADGYYAQNDSAGGSSPDQSGSPDPNDQSGENTQSAENSAKEENISDYPTLIYDGPFSESNEKAQPRGLPEGEVDENTALLRAVEWLGGGNLTASGYEEGNIPVYAFAGTDAEGRSVEITVTKQGGAVLWMMRETAGGADGVPEEDVTKRLSEAAGQFLEDHGYEGMEPTYAQFYNGTAVFNFAATQDDVILYADLIKVYVEESSGAVVGMDAANYLTSHTPRDLPSPELDETQAGYAVSDSLDVQSVQLALIPKTASTEVLCYEFKGKCSGISFIVYINAQTGAEEEIYQIIDSDEGQLVV